MLSHCPFLTAPPLPRLLDCADIIITRNSASIQASPDFNDDEDFIKRMEHYRKHYETLQETEGSYIKRYDSGDRIHMHGIHGFVRTKISSFVMNIHTAPRTIYLVRSGETEYIRKGMIGGGQLPLSLCLSPSLSVFLSLTLSLSLSTCLRLTVSLSLSVPLYL
jgi:hypothetical protein